MQPIPFNAAEAMIDTFWDPATSGLEAWSITPGQKHGLYVKQSWCAVQFGWQQQPASGAALSMQRTLDLDCSQYDTLLLSVMAPEHAIVTLRALSDVGDLLLEAEPAGLLKRELQLPLKGASRIRQLHIAITAGRNGAAEGWFNWIGLQHSELLARHLAQFSHYDEQWEGYLQAATFEPSFEPSYGLAIDLDLLPRIRQQHASHIDKYGTSPIMELAADAARISPERMISDSVNFWNDTRYNRVREHGKILLTHGPHAAYAGLVTRDKSLMRLAARYAMSIAMCDHWDVAPLTRFPGSPWEHRAFVPSLCMHETSIILDLAGEWFTDLGRNYILRRIAEHGQGMMNYNAWKHEYIYHNNQLAWFTPGRVLAYCLLAQEMPRVRPYLDLAIDDLNENLQAIIHQDGGNAEGPTYFTWTIRQALLSYSYYARSRGVSLASLLPESILNTADHAEVLASTDSSSSMLLICDAMNVNAEALAMLAALLPDSHWVNLHNKETRRHKGAPSSYLAWEYAQHLPATGPDYRPLVSLPDTGMLAFHRKLSGGGISKLMIIGNKSGAGHTHEDKGSFILEYDGETFAAELGTTDYSNPVAEQLKQAQRHNMLLPTGTLERPRPDNPIHADIYPQGHSDGVALYAEVDLMPGWEAYFTTRKRQFSSPDPQHLTITDDFELVQGTGVVCYWITRLPVHIEENRIWITGKRHALAIHIPEDCVAHVETLPLVAKSFDAILHQRKDLLSGNLFLEESHSRISICQSATTGRLELHTCFSPCL